VGFSEERIMAKYLTRERLARIEGRLRERERELRHEIRTQLEASDVQRHRELAGLVLDAGDESVTNMLVDLGVASIERDVRELGEIESALERIGSGRYGLCTDCGDEIAPERLEANPAAARCILCQAKHEREFAQPGGATL
jgi:RNA polymerase-binding transcription factor DksA